MCNLIFSGKKKTSSREWTRSAPNILMHSLSPELTLNTGAELNFSFAMNNFSISQLFIWFNNKKTVWQCVSFVEKLLLRPLWQLVSFNPLQCGFLRIIFWLDMLQGQIKLNNNTSLDSSALRLLLLGQTKEQTRKLVLQLLKRRSRPHPLRFWLAVRNMLTMVTATDWLAGLWPQVI